MKWADNGRKRMHDGANSLGNLLVEGFHYFGLFAIGAATAWASAGEVALESSWTFSVTVRPRSLKDSRMLAG